MTKTACVLNSKMIVLTFTALLICNAMAFGQWNYDSTSLWTNCSVVDLKGYNDTRSTFLHVILQNDWGTFGEECYDTTNNYNRLIIASGQDGENDYISLANYLEGASPARKEVIGIHRTTVNFARGVIVNVGTETGDATERSLTALNIYSNKREDTSRGYLNFEGYGMWNANTRSRVITAGDRAFIDYKTEDGGKGTWIFGSQFGGQDVLTINGKTNRVNIANELRVDGKIYCEELKVQMSQNWPDYVFEPGYSLMPLTKLEKYVTEKKHLPGIAPAAEVEKNGMEV